MKFEMRNLTQIFFILWLTAGNGFAFEATLSINPPLISLGESAQARVEVRGAKRPPAPKLPQVDGLLFVGSGQSTQTRITNGKIEVTTIFTLTVYPQRTGEFTMGPSAYTIDGETQTLHAQLKVVATSGDADLPQSWDDLVFARLSSTRDKVYVQEPFELTLSIYTRAGIQLLGSIDLQGMPETGLSELTWKDLPVTREQIDGQIFDVRQFRTTVRTLGAGLFEFAPSATIQVAMPNQRQQRSDPFFNPLFDQIPTHPVELVAEKSEVLVLPLPVEGRPDGFNGAVGRFNFSVTADPLKVHPGDPVTVTMILVGNGNFERVLPPALPENGSFRLFGDAVRQRGNNEVRFEQVISPRNAEVTEIPPITFSFFDTATEQYRTLTRPAIPIEVTASANDTAQVFAAKEVLAATPAGQPFASESDVQRFLGWLKRWWKTIRPWLWTLPAALGTGLLLFFGQKFYHSRRRDTAWVRRQQAPKAARRALRNAERACQQGDAAAFYTALGNAITDYFGNRLNLPPGEASALTIERKLQERHVPQDLTQQLRSLLEHVDEKRYAPSTDTLDRESAKQLQNQATQLLRRLARNQF